MRLILMRHGETEWNAEQRLQGQDNSLLSERGVAQVKRFRAYAKALQPARIIASDLGRTRQTVALIGHPDAPSDQRFRELDMGEWTGRCKPDLIAERPEDYAAWRAGRFTPDRGEPGVPSAPASPRACATGWAAPRATFLSWPMAASFVRPATNSSTCRRPASCP